MSELHAVMWIAREFIIITSAITLGLVIARFIVKKLDSIDVDTPDILVLWIMMMVGASLMAFMVTAMILVPSGPFHALIK